MKGWVWLSMIACAALRALAKGLGYKGFGAGFYIFYPVLKGRRYHQEPWVTLLAADE